VQTTQEHDAENHSQNKFLVELGDGAFDKTMANDTLFVCIEDLKDEDISSDNTDWIVTDVFGRQDPLRESHIDYKGSVLNVLLLWDDVSETYEPLASKQSKPHVF
jgi:hypothetical protein